MKELTEYVKDDLRRRRAALAKAIHLTLLSDPTPHPELKREGETCAQATARIAVEHADALIKELNR